MLFNSAEFLLGFLPIVLLVYYLLPHRAQNAFLVVASCVFYASWDWRFLFPLLFTTSLDYWISQKLDEARRDGASEKVRRRYLTLSVVANLGLLGVFKYFNFFAQSAVELAQFFGLQVSVHTFEIVLPVAISFYTFQALSYTIDVYRGQLHATRSFWDFFLAVLYFPHLVAGPIQRASFLLPQITRPRQIRWDQVKEGLHLIVWGFYKKVVIADNLAPIVERCYSTPNPTGGDVLVGALAFGFQVYGDFSGYTDIARGIAKIMGFEFTLNFNLPFLAANPGDFWRRWHISLSTWLRDYLYAPLGGNRDGPSRTYLNIMITMLLGGLWHGAAWNYVIWGFYQGLVQVLHRVLKPALDMIGRPFSAVPSVWLVIRILCMFTLTTYSWVLFRAHSGDQIMTMTRALADPLEGINHSELSTVLWLGVPLMLIQIVQFRTGELFFTRLAWIPTSVKVIFYALLLYLLLLHGGQPQSFVYFQF